jgi:transcriptional regulator of heat shock response
MPIMDDRKRKILKAIVERFIQTATPVGSKLIFEEYDLNISPATIRNEMALLESEGFITQPHTSAGRVPTGLAYRLFVDQLQFNLRLMNQARDDMEQIRRSHYLKQAKEKLFDMVSILATATNNVSFATLPDDGRLFYMGICNVLRQPEFIENPGTTTQVIEVLETRFAELLKEIEIRDEPSYYIGEENLLPEFKSCSLLVQRYRYKGFTGAMGILGATRMNYAYNTVALRSAVELLNDASWS